MQMKQLLEFLAANKHVGDVEDAYHFALGLEGYKALTAASPKQSLVVASVTPAILLSGKVRSAVLHVVMALGADPSGTSSFVADVTMLVPQKRLTGSF